MMAKTKTKTAGTAIVVKESAPRRAVQRVRTEMLPAARRHVSNAARKLRETKAETKSDLLTIGAGAALGYIESHMPMPSLPLLGVPGTIGLVATVAGHVANMPVLRDIGTAGLTISAYQLAGGGGGANAAPQRPAPRAEVKGDDAPPHPSKVDADLEGEV